MQPRLGEQLVNRLGHATSNESQSRQRSAEPGKAILAAARARARIQPAKPRRHHQEGQLAPVPLTLAIQVQQAGGARLQKLKATVAGTRTRYDSHKYPNRASK